MTGEPGLPQQSAPSGRDEDEVARLRKQVERLNAELEAAQSAPVGGPAAAGTVGATGRHGGWWRPWVAGLLIAVAALIAPVSVVANWAHDTVSDTDRYVETVTPLASDPAVKTAIVNRITREIFARLDVTALTQDAVDALAAQGLPPRVADGLKALSVPLANGVRGFVTEQVTRIVDSPEFEQAWIAANREAHTQLVAVLTGQDTDQVTVTDDAVQVNLAAVIETVKARLSAAGFGLAARLPTVNAQFTVFQSADLAKAQDAFHLLDVVARVLPFLGLLLIAVAVYVSRDRRRALMAAGLAVAGGMLLLGAALNGFRPLYLDAIPEEASRAAAASIYDTLTEFIRLSLRAVLVVALAVAAGAWLSGRSSAAVATRRGFSRATGAVRGGAEGIGVNTGPVGEFAYRYRTALRALVIGVGVLVYVQAEHPTGAWTLKVIGVLVVVLVLVELVARPPQAAPPTAA